MKLPPPRPNHARFTNHNAHIYQDNDVEFFIAGRDSYYEFEINAANAKLDMFLPSRGAGGYPRFKSDGEFHIDSKVLIDGTPLSSQSFLFPLPAAWEYWQVLALLAGLTARPAATEFAFLVGIPTMFAATGYEFLKLRHAGFERSARARG